MDKFLLESLPIIKILGYIFGSSIATIILSKWLGKSREEAEIVLNWEQIHEKRDKKLLSEIERLEVKIDELVRTTNKEREQHRSEILRWENSNMQLREDLTRCRQSNGKLQLKIDRYEKKNL